MFITKILYVPCVVFIVFSLPLAAMETSRIELLSGGMGVGNGIVQGRACVVAGLSELTKICKGDIVIASTTNDSWNKALKKSAGIITEDGGNNSHAALLGKKLGIPVIVGVSNATKRIIDGSSIGFDCAHTIVYQIIQHVTCIKSDISSLVSHGYNYGSLFFEQEHNDISDNINDKPTSEKKTKKVNLVKKENKHKYQHQHIVTDFTHERLRNDMPLIRQNIVTNQQNIGLAKSVGKWVATWQITGQAYDCIPFEFCASENAHYLDEAFNKLEEGIEYMRATKQAFKDEILKKKTKIDNSEIAVFLYNKVVEHIDADNELKAALKEDPTKMDEYVRQGIVDKAQYMYYTLLNFTTRYYLEQELQKK